MKKTVIICILSISLCLSTAAPAADDHSTADKPDLKKENATKSIAETAVNVTISPTAEKNATETKPEVKPKEEDSKTGPKQPNIKPNEKPMEQKPANTEDNKTVPKNTEMEPAKTSDKPTETAPVKSTEKSPEKAETKSDAKETTTPHAVTVKTTEAPKSVTEKPMQAARGFDGPSFIGGIILTLGLLAIGFMGFKYYKNQTERNYHTL